MADVSGFYQQLGGDAAMTAIVEQLYERVLANARLAAYFAHGGVDALREHQRDFLAALFDGPARTSGLTLQEAHTGLHITDADFDRLLQHFRDTLTERGVAELLAERAIARVQVLRPQVVHW